MASMTLCSAIVAACVMVTCNAQSQDTTLLEGAFGTSVVNAVIDRIRARCVFSEDRLFLRRLAHVASQDGQDSATYRPGFDGGIWQVPEAMFLATQDPSNAGQLSDALTAIQSGFAIHWAAVGWRDLRRPLYSGLAAALATRLQVTSAMPGGIPDQAALWATMYGEPEQKFSNAVTNLTQPGCGEEMDLLFLLDSSGSVSGSDFQLMLKFAGDVVSAMTVGENEVLVAGLSFSSSPRRHFSFRDHVTTSAASSALRAIGKVSGGTNTAKGLDLARTTLYDASFGGRPSAKKVAVLVTDGQSNSMSQTTAAAQRLKDEGTTVFAVGVGGYRLSELKAAASDPICSHVTTLTSFQDIQSILSAIQRGACDASLVMQAATDTEITKNLTDNVEVPVQVRNPVKTDTLEASVLCGILDIYVSAVDPRPSAAVHDDKYQATPWRPAQLTVTDTLPSGQTLYITVTGTKLPVAARHLANCSDFTFTIRVAKKTNLTVICEVDGIRRPCSSADMEKAKLCNTSDDSSLPVDNPCTPDNIANGFMRHVYPWDSTKFLQCDMRGQHYVTLCPGGVAFNPQSRECGFQSPGVAGSTRANTKVKGSKDQSGAALAPLAQASANPCSQEALKQNKFYHTYSADKTKFVQCDEWGKAWVRPCAAATTWSQAHYTCVSKDTPPAAVATPPATTPSTTTSNNPTTTAAPSGVTVTCNAGDLYVADPCDKHTYYQCVHGVPREMKCADMGPAWGKLYYNPAIMQCGWTDPNPTSVRPAACP